MKKIRVLVVDEQTVVREGIAAVLRDFSDLDVIGQAHDGSEALEIALQRFPDVVVLDPVMKENDGLTMIPQLRNLAAAPRILLLTTFCEGDLVRDGIRAGALGCLPKDASLEELLEAIRKVAQGKASLHPSIAMSLIWELNSQEKNLVVTSLLTPREQETLNLIARGLSNQEIAAVLVVHERTVAKYVSSILTKLEVTNRTQAALYALRLEGRRELPTRPRDDSRWTSMHK